MKAAGEPSPIELEAARAVGTSLPGPIGVEATAVTDVVGTAAAATTWAVRSGTAGEVVLLRATAGKEADGAGRLRRIVAAESDCPLDAPRARAAAGRGARADDDEAHSTLPVQSGPTGQ